MRGHTREAPLVEIKRFNQRGRSNQIDCARTWGEARTVDIRLPRKGKSNTHCARPVHQIITMIKWSWTSRLSIKNSLEGGRGHPRVHQL